MKIAYKYYESNSDIIVDYDNSIESRDKVKISIINQNYKVSFYVRISDLTSNNICTMKVPGEIYIDKGITRRCFIDIALKTKYVSNKIHIEYFVSHEDKLSDSGKFTMTTNGIILREKEE